MPIDDPRADNRDNWDDRVAGHIAGYRVDRYVNDPAHLSDIVIFDQDRLGELRGKKVLHLQCHIGTDTITLARLGAEVTGIDFAPSAIGACRELFTATATPGRLCITEAHPVAWALDQDRDDQLLVLGYPYFEGRMQTWDEDFSYLGDATLTHTVSHEWNHGLGEIFTALLRRGFVIKLFEEHRVLPWRMHSWMEEDAAGWFRFPEDVRDQVPLMYSLVAEKPPSSPPVESR